MTALTIQIPASAADRYRECGAVVIVMDPQPSTMWANGEVAYPAPVQPGGEIVFRWLVYQPTGNLRRSLSRTVTSIVPVLGRELTEEQCGQLGFKGWYLPLHPDIGSTDGRTPHEEMIEAWNAEHPDSPWDGDRWYWYCEL